MNEVSSVMRVKDVVVQDGGCFFRCANKKGFNKNTNIPEGSVAGLNSIVGWGIARIQRFTWLSSKRNVAK